MSTPTYIQKTLGMKPEVAKIFDDLDEWLDHCRFNLIEYNPADLYKSAKYKEFKPELDYQSRKSKKEFKAKKKKEEK